VPDNVHPAKIISLSLAGQSACPDYLQSAVIQAVGLGSIIIAAAGNNQNVSGHFPANCKGVIPVAASTREGKLAGYSNWGNLIAVSAPGGDSANAIMTLSVDEMETDFDVSYGIGTSFAVPHVSGVVALIRQDENKSFGEVFDKYIMRIANSSSRFNLTCNAQRCAGRLVDVSKLLAESATYICSRNLGVGNNCGDSLSGSFCAGGCNCPAGFRNARWNMDGGWVYDESTFQSVNIIGFLPCHNT
jgi:subtilisin family serine protease